MYATFQLVKNIFMPKKNPKAVLQSYPEIQILVGSQLAY